jgi:predicted branched-subunit amino acid permease
VSVTGSMGQGIRATGGYAIGALMFGLVFGSASFATGMPSHQSLLLSATAFAGAAQFAALPFWTHPLPWLAMGISVALISTRNILMGLSLASEFRKAPWPLRFLAIWTLVDASWALSMRHKGRADLTAFYCGSSLTLYFSWLAGVAVGIALPDVLDPVTIAAIGFGGVIFLSLVLVMLAKSRIGPRMPWIVSGAAAIGLSYIAPPHLVLLGAVTVGAASALVFRATPA